MRSPLAQRLLSSDTEARFRARVGRITNDNPVEVDLDGQGGLPASYLANYSPQIGDVVLIGQNDTDLIIFDRLIPGG